MRYPAARIVSRQVLGAPAEVARRPGLARGDTALRLQRVRSYTDGADGIENNMGTFMAPGTVKLARAARMQLDPCHCEQYLDTTDFAGVP